MTQQPVVPKEPHVGQRVARMFVPEHNTQKPQLYFGRVVEFWANKEGGNEELWRIQYNDGDEEDLNAKEIAKALKQGKPVPLNSVGIEFAHFVHARMIKWLIVSRFAPWRCWYPFHSHIPGHSHVLLYYRDIQRECPLKRFTMKYQKNLSKAISFHGRFLIVQRLETPTDIWTRELLQGGRTLKKRLASKVSLLHGLRIKG